MHRRFILLAILVLVPILLGCPGNRSIDHEANEALWEWIQEQDANGWNVAGFEATYTDIVVDHEFRPTRLQLAINGDAVNPYHQRNLLGQIAQQWQNMYPANMRPRFNLRVELYNREISNDTDLGYCEIDRDGNIDTHHGATQDVM